MRLKRIELYGFKSFGQKTVLHFDRPISVIVGPNGSGKSNIADAVRWVLGEQSAKSLRGGKMEDVIFSGTDRKKPLNMTQVSLTLDNTDGDLPVAYDEVVVTRKLFRSGETEYALNKTACRLKDIRTLFMDTGVGKEGYSIIGQGKIDEIISARDQDRRELFEEATGISRFRYQIEEARSRLRKTKENLLRVEDIIAQLQEQLRYLSREAEKARRGMELAREHEKHTLAFYDREMQAAEKLAAGLTEEKSLLADSLRKASARREELLAAIRPLLSEEEALLQQLTALDEHARMLQKNLESAERGRQLSEQKSEFLIRENERLRQQRDTLDAEHTRAQKQQRALAEEEKQLRAEHTAARAACEEAAQELNRLRRKAETMQARRETAAREIRTLSEQRQEGLLALHAQKNAAQLRAVEEGRLAASITQEQERYETSRRERDTLQTETDRVEAAYDAMVASLEAVGQRLNEAEQTLRGEEEPLRDRKNRYETKHRRLLAVEHMIRNHEGYHRSVQQLLRAADKDCALRERFLGPLGSLLTVTPDMRVAVEVALGAAMHQIVTPAAADAKALIEWLKENRVGRATFLPMDQIKPYVYRGPSPPKDRGGVGFALEFVQAQADLSHILSSLLARTFIIENLDAGIALRKDARYDKLRLVTRAGELLMPGGSMVGGYLQKDAGLLSRETEREALEKDVRTLETEIREQEATIDALLAGTRKDTAHRDRIREEGRQLHEKRRTARERLAAKEAKLDIYRQNLEQMRQQLTGLQTQEDNPLLPQELEAMQQALQKKEVTYRQLEADREFTQEALARAERTHVLAEAETDRLERDRSLLKNRSADLQETLQAREKERQEIRSQTEANAAARDEEEKRQILFRTQMQETVSKIEKTEKDTQTARENLERVRASLAQREQERTETEQQFRELETEQATHALRLENALEKVRRIVETVAVELNLTEEDAEEKLKDAPQIRTGRTRLRQIREQLRAIGSFSYEAIEEHRAVRERFEFLSAQSEDLRASGEDLTEVIRTLETTMRRQFREGMTRINEKFTQVFRILFDGGHAEVALTGEDVLEAGVQIIARPPGKSRQAISLLSGGEKALTAVALLFAIFETRPSPFCVLDEIDAALDDANIARYKQYLESFRGRIQFIIITHRKQTMELADIIYGVTMQENSTSRIIPLELADKKKTQSA